MGDDLYDKKIMEGLKKLAASYGPEAIIPVNVVAVDENEFTCDCITDDDITVPGVLFKSVSGGEIDLVIQPAVGSRCYIGRVSDSDEWIMIKAGEISSIRIKIGTTRLNLSADGIVMNEGTLGGMVKRDGVRTQLNKLENELNTLKKILLSWVPVAGDGGGALKVKVQSWAGSNLKKTQNDDIENTQVKQ